MGNPIWENIELKKRGLRENITKVLTNIPIFCELSSKELKEVVKIVYRREYKAEEPIFRKNDPGLGMYIIESGSVEIVNGSNEEERQLAVLEGGSFFGDLSLLDESPRSASALALADCQIIGFFRPDLLDMLNRKPKLGIKILFALAKVVGERLRRTNEKFAKVQNELKALKNG